MPDGLGYVLDWYTAICGPEALTWTEIRAWSELTHANITAWEAELLMSLDRIRRSVACE